MFTGGREGGCSWSQSYQDRTLSSPLDAWEVHLSRLGRRRSADASVNNSGRIFDNFDDNEDGRDGDGCREDGDGNGAFEIAEASTSAEASAFRYAASFLRVESIFLFSIHISFDFAIISYFFFYPLPRWIFIVLRVSRYPFTPPSTLSRCADSFLEGLLFLAGLG
jgi:hypothetical protein